MTTSTNLMTAEELFLLDDGLRHELVKGELLTMSPPGEEHGAVTMNLSILLGQHIKAHQLGRLYAAETGFKLESDPDTVLAPDIAFIRRERMGPVISPGESNKEVKLETERWLEFGARLVWLVRPKTKTVEVHRRNSNHLLTESDLLTGEEVVVRFQIAVSEIFD